MKGRKGWSGWMAAALAAVLLAGCGGGNGGTGEDEAVPAGSVAASGIPLEGKLVVWTFYDQGRELARKFGEKHPGVTVDVVMLPADQYRDKLAAALQTGGDAPDLFDLEREYIGAFVNTPYLADLSELGADELLADYIPYVAELGKSSDGRIKAVADQASPGAFWYKRETAKELLGTDDPDAIGEMVDSLDKIAALGKQVNEKSGGKVRLLADAGDLIDIEASHTEPWVKDGKLSVDPRWRAVYEAQLGIRAAGGDAQLPFMTAGWSKALNDGSVVLTAMPAWASFIVDNRGGKADGQFGVAKTPKGYDAGGMYRGVYSGSKNRDLAYEFVKFAASPEWQAYNLRKNGSMPAIGKVYQDEMSVYQSPLLGNENVLQIYYDMIAAIPPRKADPYGEALLDMWRKHAGKGLAGNVPYEEVAEGFKADVRSAFPELGGD